MANLSPIVVVLAFFVAIVAILAAYGLQSLRTAYRVYTREPDDVMVAPSGGPVELEGTARPAKGTIESPFTGTDCLLCEYEIEEYGSGEGFGNWTTIDEDRIVVPFLVDDGTGTVLVEPAGVQTTISREARIEVDGGTEPPSRIRQFVEGDPDLHSENRNLDLSVIELTTGTDRRYTERRLDPGESVHVLGHARYGRDGLDYAGSVNATVGPRLPGDDDGSILSRLRDRFVARTFVISDTSAGRTAWGIAWPGLVALSLAAVGAGFLWMLVP
jgi:hypothetical protein